MVYVRLQLMELNIKISTTQGAAIFLHYTEELFLEGATQLNTFALEFDEEGSSIPKSIST